VIADDQLARGKDDFGLLCLHSVTLFHSDQIGSGCGALRRLGDSTTRRIDLYWKAGLIGQQILLNPGPLDFTTSSRTGTMQNPHNLNQIPISSHPSTSIPLESPLSHVLPVYLNEVNEGALAGSDSCHSGHSGRSGRSLRSYEIPERRETEDTAILKDAARPGTSVGRGVTRTDSARRNLNGDQSRTEYLARYRKDGRKYDDDEIKRPGGAVLPPLPLISPLSSHFGERTGSHVDTVQERYYGDDKSGHPSTLSTVTLPHSPSQTTQTNGSRYSPYSPYPPNTTENPSFSPQTIYSETTEDYFKPKSLADLDELGAGGLVSPLRLSDGRSVGLGFGDKPRRKVLGRVESSTRTGWSRVSYEREWDREWVE
jgi:hypothetical protein